MSSGRVTIGIVVGVLMAFSTCRVNAAEWSLEPSLRVKGEYNSNLTITDQQHEAVWGHWVSPSAKFQGATENFEVSSRLAADFVQYYGEGDRSLTNIYLPITMHYRTERDTFGLEGGYVRDNTLLNELKLTGVVLAFTQRNERKVSPSWSHQLGEKLNWDNTYTFTDVTYENGLRLGLADYRTHMASTGLTYKLTERDDLQASLVYGDLTISDFQQQSRFYGFQVAGQHLFSDTLKVTLSAGSRFVNSSRTTLAIESPPGVKLTADQTVWVGSAEIVKAFERTTVTLSASRDVFPSGFGLLIRSNRIGGNVSHSVTENINLSFLAQYYAVGSVTSGATRVAFADTAFLTFSPSALFKLSDWWSVECAYIYSQRTVDERSIRAESNAAYVSLVYNIPKLSVSR